MISQQETNSGNSLQRERVIIIVKKSLSNNKNEYSI